MDLPGNSDAAFAPAYHIIFSFDPITRKVQRIITDIFPQVPLCLFALPPGYRLSPVYPGKPDFWILSCFYVKQMVFRKIKIQRLIFFYGKTKKKCNYSRIKKINFFCIRRNNSWGTNSCKTWNKCCSTCDKQIFFWKNFITYGKYDESHKQHGNRSQNGKKDFFHIFRCLSKSTALKYCW